jgi:hypothetical protein
MTHAATARGADTERNTPMPDLDDIKRFAEDHDEQLDQGMEKAGDAAGDKFGHQDQIDRAVDKGQDAIDGGDQ